MQGWSVENGKQQEALSENHSLGHEDLEATCVGGNAVVGEGRRSGSEGRRYLIIGGLLNGHRIPMPEEFLLVEKKVGASGAET